MNTFVGVKGLADLDVPLLKHCALVFSQIAIPGVEHLKVSPITPEIEWLQTRGIVFAPKYSNLATTSDSTDSTELRRAIEQEMLEMSNCAPKLLASVHTDKAAETHVLLKRMCDATARTVSVDLRTTQHMDAYPVLGEEPAIDTANRKAIVLQIVLKSLPIPDDRTSWEQILEYRSDPDSYQKFLDLRNWMNDVARGDLTPLELEQKLEFLISQYERHVALHKMATNHGVIETVLISSAELAESLIKFKWGHIAKMLFSVKRRRIALLEGELTSPGAEVAYILKARATFS